MKMRDALAMLRANGYDISSRTLALHRTRIFTPKRRDVARFKKWLTWASSGHGRKFVVAVAGIDRHSVTFHSLDGLNRRTAHAIEMRANAKEAK